MKVIAMASQKGGVGKTTLAGHLAVAAEAAGMAPVALVDTDPQGSLAAWWNERKADTPLFVQVRIDELPSQLKALASQVKLVIIDTPPAITEAIRSVIRVSDLVLIPTRPSPHDLRAVGATVDLGESEGRSMVFIVNGGTVRARLTGEAAVALSQHGRVAPVTIHQRVDYAASMIDGRTVVETDPASAGAREIAELWKYVDTQLRKRAVATARGVPVRHTSESA